MPEIGYWKYIRFNDDEPQYFGTDDDITIVFDSADDRLEYRMKKDIRFEDDAGAEILTIQKATRTLSGFKMTGDLEIEKDTPTLILDDSVGTKPRVSYQVAGSEKMRLIYDGVNHELWIWDVPGVSKTVIFDVATGSIACGDVDLRGNLLKNAKLGSSLDFNDWYAYKVGLLELKEKTTPTTPATGYGRIYFKTDGRLYYLNDAGVEYGPL